VAFRQHSDVNNVNLHCLVSNVVCLFLQQWDFISFYFSYVSIQVNKPGCGNGPLNTVTSTYIYKIARVNHTKSITSKKASLLTLINVPP
jgi:hypothetical protein